MSGRARGRRGAGSRPSGAAPDGGAGRPAPSRDAGRPTPDGGAGEAAPSAPALPALAARGAARGAEALASLVGDEVGAGPLFAPGPQALAAFQTGVLFELRGALAGAVAVLFSAPSRRALLQALGPAAAAAPGSALCEVANIVASQAVCAIAEGLGASVALSVPRLVERGAGAALAGCLEAGGRALASELRARGAPVRAWLVVLPGAAAPRCDTVGA
jgi:hypothetical protein